MANFSKDTSGRSLLGWCEALIVLFLGLTVAHLGISLFLLASFGSDPFTVMVQGIALTAGVSVGTVHVIISTLLMAVMFLTTKGYVMPGTVICAFCGGPIINFFSWLLSPVLSGSSPLPLRLLGVVLGCVILALGMSVVINSEAGTGPNDLIAMILTDRLKRFQFRWVRMACDLCFLIAGFLLGGVVGVGTLVAVFLVGPCAQLWLPITKKWIPAYAQKKE
ncbi:MAG: YitT family protein [Clostridiales bacterium]|nr:YitT family protein [Clostridiales bacterium]